MPAANIQYYGFDFPPHSLISILKSLDFEEPACVILFDPFTGIELPYDQIRDLSKKNLYIIITTQEGASDRWFDRLIWILVNDCGVLQSNIILRSSCLYNPNSSIKHIHTFVDNCFKFMKLLEDKNLTVCPETTRHFVCLNRRHRWQRYSLVINLLDRRLEQFGTISYLELPPACIIHHTLLFDADLVDSPVRTSWARYRSKFPLTIDKKVISEFESHNTTHPDITGALFNVITESSYENTDFTHYLPMLSEKSFKCFALHQIPIWLTPYRSVSFFRAAGFDVFDDIVDHGYDLESDPIRRIDLVTEQIEKICKLTDLHNIRQRLEPRFLKNINTLRDHTNHQIELPQWKKIFFG